MERYQQALHVDRTEPGERDSADRWDAIEPHLPRSGLVLDVGSNLGYFGLRAVTARSEVAVVSIESSPRIAERQRQLLEEHGTTRVCLVQGTMDARTARNWATTCDWFQLTLMLSILHWMDDPAQVLRYLSSMSGSLIVEVPDAGDVGACGRSNVMLWGSDPLAWFRQETGRTCTTLARIGRHTSDVPSHLIHVGGSVSRRPRKPYWGYDFRRQEPRDYEITYDGRVVELRVGEKLVDYRPGVNLLSLMHLGTLLHPPKRWWREDGERAVRTASEHGDPYPHNMLWTERGIVLIDGDDLIVERAPADVMASLDRNLALWERGRTRQYVREVLGPRRLMRRIVGRFARRLLGDRVVERVKAALADPPGP